MTVTRLWDLLVAMIALAIAASLIGTNLLAATCLVQYVVLTVLEYESEAFRTVADSHPRAVSIGKLSLLLVAAAAVVY